MTYDRQEILSSFHAKESLSYPLLQDIDAKHVDALGIRNVDYEPGHNAYGIPYPGILFIRADGTIAAKFAVPGYRSRPPFEDVFGVVESVLN